MRDVIFGLVAIAAGALFCFRGYLAFRIVIPIWGAFVGFGFGAGLVASITGDGFLRTALAWAVGAAVALVFALFAYLFYAVAIVIAMGSIGFALGTTAMVALGASWTWFVVLIGAVVGGLFAILAIMFDLPTVVLILLSALGGASAITAGLMLLFGTVDTSEFDEDNVTKVAGDAWWWYAIYAALVLVGIVAQGRMTQRLRGSVRDAWVGEGG